MPTHKSKLSITTLQDFHCLLKRITGIMQKYFIQLVRDCVTALLVSVVKYAH
jgi:hypothetical protein